MANKGQDETQTVVVRSKSNIKNNRTIGIKNNDVKAINIKVYPNPASDLLNVEVFMKNGEEADIVVENILGQDVYAAKTTEQKTTINTSSFNRGVYFVKVKTAKGTSVEKVVVE
ncbi:MAG: T9SS type A sorting domain-containing protein [Bacteroidetes bacterium]|nr:T9SS type A sorting domain-containing protein [Bacteroidota bacterium]